MVSAELLQNRRDGAVTYGVSIISARGTTRTYPDISASRPEAERLLRRLRTDDVSPLHYDDIVRDYIIELAFERIQRNGLT